MKRALFLAVLLVASSGCYRGCPSPYPPIHPNPNMDDQNKVTAQEESDFFYDGSAMRVPVQGTVARGELIFDPALSEGRDAAGEFLKVSPVAIDEALLARGDKAFAISCTPCHDRRGTGKGILYERASVPTANLLDPRIVEMGDGELFDVISNGKGLMRGYRYPLGHLDRWAIVAHIRRMQSAAR